MTTVSFWLIFKDNFMKSPKNKESLNCFLAKTFLEIHNTGIVVVITIENGILTNDTTLRTDLVISSCSAEEADQKLVQHVLQCLLTGIKTIVVKTVYTDGFLLLLAYRPSGGNFSSKVYVRLGISKLDRFFYSINDIALDLGDEVCQALAFFHAYTGCDTVLSFFNHGKCKFWNRWFDFENESLLTNVFSELSQRPTNITVERTTHLEKVFIVCLLSPYDWHIRFKCSANPEFWTLSAQ